MTMLSSSHFLNLLSNLFYIVIGITLGIAISSYTRTFSFNLPIKNAGFPIAIFTASQPSPSPSPSPPPLNLTSANTTLKNADANASRVVNKDSLISPTVTLPQNMSDGDEELLRRASLAPKNADVAAPKRVAFMFLTRGPVTLAPLWEMFFRGHDGLFSIYVHSDPDYVGSEPRDSVFHGRRIPSKKVEWGNVNLIEAESRLLANALVDTSNQYFVLLSESCIPIFNFSTVYSYLLNSTHSFVESYDLPGPVGRGRYIPHMAPLIQENQWRKGSQWFAIDRELASEVVSDNTYFSSFEANCPRRCYADEHYLPTFVNIKFGERNSNRSLTWVDWSKGGPHPARFWRQHVTPQFLEWLRSGSTCEYNGERTNMCFMFARKFTKHALWRLLKFAPKVLHFNN